MKIRKKKPSEFEIFDHQIGKKVDKIICKKSLELEEKLINIAKNSQVREYLKMRFSDDLDKKKFDDFFQSIDDKKNRIRNFVNSNSIKSKCKTIDTYLKKIPNSNIEKTINFIDEFNVDKANEILDEINKITPLLDPASKEEFRDNAKKLIEELIFKCYEENLEPKIKELAINLGEKLIDTIQKIYRDKSRSK